jgi:hypothetical protein
LVGRTRKHRQDALWPGGRTEGREPETLQPRNREVVDVAGGPKVGRQPVEGAAARKEIRWPEPQVRGAGEAAAGARVEA